jgi:LPS sulfotransferase NodH
MAKATFTLDDETLRTIRKLAERRRKPQSLVVREAVAHYAAAEDKLSADEQAHMLSVLEDLRKTIPTRPRPAVQKDLRELRSARGTGWTRRWEK